MATTTPCRPTAHIGGSEIRDDRALVEACRRHDQSAWATLVRRHSGRLRAIARYNGLSSAAADDVVQAVWTELFHDLHKLRDPAAVGGWLATAARRKAIKMSRAERRAPIALDQPAELRQPDEELLAEEQTTALRNAFAKLPASDQQLLGLLFAVETVSYCEIARTIGRSVGSIGPTRARSLSRLRALLEAEPLHHSEEQRSIA